MDEFKIRRICEHVVNNKKQYEDAGKWLDEFTSLDKYRERIRKQIENLAENIKAEVKAFEEQMAYCDEAREAQDRRTHKSSERRKDFHITKTKEKQLKKLKGELVNEPSVVTLLSEALKYAFKIEDIRAAFESNQDEYRIGLLVRIFYGYTFGKTKLGLAKFEDLLKPLTETRHLVRDFLLESSKARVEEAINFAYANLFCTEKNGDFNAAISEAEETQTENALSAEAKALALLVGHPDWPNTKIAKSVGVSRTTLYNWPNFKKAKEVLKQGKNNLLKGSKNGETGNIEAWNSKDQDDILADT